MTDETGWEDFKESEISNEELSQRLAEPSLPMIPGTEVPLILEEQNKLHPLPSYGEFADSVDIFAVNFKAKPIDRFGTCPHCQASWDGGDIYEELLKKSILSVSIGDAKKTAAMYGWTETDKKHFSTLLTYELEGGIFVECPDCNTVFNQDTSKEYKSLYDVKQELYEQKELS